MNLKELSNILGLSQTTVSRALNGYPEVNEDTRRRVFEVAKQYHYSPNASARRLATGRSGAIGIVLGASEDQLHDPLFIEFLSGLTCQAGEKNTDVVVSAPVGELAETYRRFSRTKSIDALILNAPLLDDPRPARISRLGLPFVFHGRAGGPISYAFMDIDNEGAFRRSCELLIGFGHRRIALLNGPGYLAFARSRQLGWQSALEHAGHPADVALVVASRMTEENGYLQTRMLLEQTNPPTAVICSSMFMALGCYRAIRDLKLVPGVDVSVIAHDDGSPAIRPESLQPSLTTTFSSIRAAGKRIAEIAIALSLGGSPMDFQEVWPVDLIFRDSVGRPKGK